MSEPAFPLFQKSRCELVGRQDLFDDVWYSLEKSPPDNVSVVGPLWFGKSTLVDAIVKKAKQTESPFALVIDWPLGHVCPTSDEEFLETMCTLLSEEIEKNKDIDQSYISHLAKNTFTSLNEITKLLDNDGHQLFVAWDGFDKAARQEGLQLSLWDQMREVFSNGHALLIATREPVADLIRNEDALVSPLWNQLNPIQIKPLDEGDQKAICQHAGLQMSKGASTELTNWTGGHPLLLLSLVNELAAKKTKGEITNDIVIDIAKTVRRQIKGPLKEIWSDCIAPAKDLLFATIEDGTSLGSKVSGDAAESLLERGFVTEVKGKLHPACKMICEYVSQSPDSGSLARLFRDEESYRENIKDVLRYRLEQIPNVDPDHLRWIGRAILDVSKNPDDCLTNLTDIRDKALELVMLHEFGEELLVPKTLVDYWKSAGHMGNKTVLALPGDEPRVPNKPVLRVGLVQLLTGSAMDLDSKSKSVSKDTYAMINAIHGLRNRKQHKEGQKASPNVAVATMTICLALLDCLSRELK